MGFMDKIDTAMAFKAMLTKTNLRILTVLLRIVNRGSPASVLLFEELKEFWSNWPAAVTTSKRELGKLETLLRQYMKDTYGSES